MAFIVGVFVRLTDPSSPSLLFLWENKLSVPGCGRFSFHVSVQCCIVGEAGGPAAAAAGCLAVCLVAYTLFEAQVLDPSAHPSFPPALRRFASSKTIPNVHDIPSRGQYHLFVSCEREVCSCYKLHSTPCNTFQSIGYLERQPWLSIKTLTDLPILTLLTASKTQKAF